MLLVNKTRCELYRPYLKETVGTLLKIIFLMQKYILALPNFYFSEMRHPDFCVKFDSLNK